ncbi:MAG: tetratricopeptide repeat protein, partial [Candidatus Melainabacteria bacterium]|nr:tetratricopeptide repeat protein [Candidatus Melainabacteria bacterium]
LSACSQTSSLSDQSIDRSDEQSKARLNSGSSEKLDWKTGTLPSASLEGLSPAMKMDPGQYLSLGEKALLVSDYKTAFEASSKALELSPKLAVAYCMRGKSRYLLSHGDQTRSIDDLQTAIKLNPRLDEAYEYLGMIYDSQKDYRKAIDVLTAGLKQFPRSSTLLECRASVFGTLGENEKALKDYSELIICMPRRGSNHIKRATHLERMGRYEEALNDYSSVIHLNQTPDLVTCDAYKKRARLLSKLGRHKEAIDDLSKTIDLDDSDDDAIRLRGDEYRMSNQLEKSIADYTKAIGLSPQYARSSYESRAAAYDALGKSDLAEKDRQSARRLEQTQAEKPVFESKPR